MNEMVCKQEYQVEKVAFAMIAIILNILSFPVKIVMNVLVIMAVKTSPRLQSKYYILLACLAGTDLLVGAASQPNFNSGECLCHKSFISVGILPIPQGDPSNVIYSYFCISVASYTY